jgi:hypothetical protein
MWEIFYLAEQLLASDGGFHSEEIGLIWIKNLIGCGKKLHVLPHNMAPNVENH